MNDTKGDRMTDRRNRDPLAIIIATVSFATQIGAWAWWGGGLSNRVDQLEIKAQANDVILRGSEERDSRQDSSLAVTGAQYADIVRRLDRIEGNQLETIRGSR